MSPLKKGESAGNKKALGHVALSLESSGEPA